MTDSDLVVTVLTDPEQDLKRQIVALEQEAFGIGGMNQWFLPPFVRYGRVYCLWKGGHFAGVCEFMRSWSDPACSYLFGVVLLPNFRGKGYGSIFLREILRQLKAEGVTRVELTVDPDNKAGLRLYSDKLGFKRVDYFEDKYGKGEDRYLMELDLDSFEEEVRQ